MHGASIPGVGWAAGIERLTLLRQEIDLQGPLQLPDVAVLPLAEPGADAFGLRLAQQLRSAGLGVVRRPSTSSVSSQLRWAIQIGARFTIVIGSNEVTTGHVTVNNMKTKDRINVGDASIAAGVIRRLLEARAPLSPSYSPAAK